VPCLRATLDLAYACVCACVQVVASHAYVTAAATGLYQATLQHVRPSLHVHTCVHACANAPSHPSMLRACVTAASLPPPFHHLMSQAQALPAAAPVRPVVEWVQALTPEQRARLVMRTGLVGGVGCAGYGVYRYYYHNRPHQVGGWVCVPLPASWRCILPVCIDSLSHTHTYMHTCHTHTTIACHTSPSNTHSPPPP
jgi:hypothetical protein